MGSKGKGPDVGSVTMGAGKGGMAGFANRGGAGGQSDIQMKADGKKPKLTRTEFVILFVWREPTPSDQLIPEEAPAGTETPVAK
jgi:hypothetical protein